ncbi:MAG: hypothetical protein AAB466_05885 [Verrucomicrobiota bacterium]
MRLTQERWERVELKEAAAERQVVAREQAGRHNDQFGGENLGVEAHRRRVRAQ